MPKLQTKPRLKGSDTIVSFRMKTADHMKIKLLAAAERRQVNQMYRELVLRALERPMAELQDHLKLHRWPTKKAPPPGDDKLQEHRQGTSDTLNPGELPNHRSATMRPRK